MIHVTIFSNEDKECVGFQTEGHAGYADPGEDIICAAISMLVINTINSIEAFTSTSYTLDMEEETGMIDFEFADEEIGHDAALLMDSMILGLQGIQRNYGNEYIILEFKEV